MKFRFFHDIDKYGFGLGFIFNRTNESKKYIRDKKTIVYTLGIVLFVFSICIEITIEK